jgi:hypothetical protein
MLDAFIPEPRLLEIDHADVAGRPDEVDAAARRIDLNGSPLIRGLFWLRSLPGRLRRHSEPTEPLALRLGEIGRSGEGFMVLHDEPGRALTVGAVGRFWEPDIEFVSLPPDRFAAFDEPGYAKVAWQIRFEPLGEHDTRVVFELRVTATDDAAWAAQRRYFRFIGPFSHFLRRHTLALLQRELGTPEAAENARRLPGDDLLPVEAAQETHGITIAATPDRIWPWLVQMGCRRGGWYSHDMLDNAARPSARVIVPALQHLEVGQVLPATPEGDDGFTVLRIDPERALVLGGAFDMHAGHAVEFFGALPQSYWRVTWAFVLEPVDAEHTRLLVRSRVDFEPRSVGLRLLWMRPIHHFMQSEQLRNLAARAEDTLPHHHDGPREIGEGLVGMLQIVAALATPFLRDRRSRWGLPSELAAREYPGDAFVPQPRWSWTHGIEVDAPPEAVWPWIAQIGRDKAGLYSYQWLENLGRLDFQNADHIVEGWQHPQVGDVLSLAPEGADIPIVAVEPGRFLLAQAEIDPWPARPPTPEPRFVRLSWLFFVEPLDDGRRSRVISRWRSASSDDFATRLLYGPLLVEPIGFVMDRRMLLGIKQRAERHAA